MSISEGLPPRVIRAKKQEGILEVQWRESEPYRIPFKLIRENCPCANCVDEITGERMLDPETVPADIVPTGMDFVGNYALKVTWSDGHSTGLYTWDVLEKLAHQAQR